MDELEKNLELKPEAAETDFSKDRTAGDATEPEETPAFPEPNQQWALCGEIGVFAISMRGASHQRSGAPCQDNNGFIWLEEAGLLICAIADGVGSCSQSHWGAETAVRTALNTLSRELQSMSGGNLLRLETVTRKQVERLFHTAFSEAQNAVEAVADSRGLPVFEFQSTLTAVVYDGRRLACCHVGDDGIVALGSSGNYAMVTNRMKGEEANSVVTLQSGHREILMTTTDITGFLMSTDGVLDAYVSGKALGNLIYYPFFEKLIYEMKPETEWDMRSSVERIFEQTRNSPEFAGITTDDLTVVAVANQRLLCNGIRPMFSQKEYDGKIRAFQQAKEEKLYPKKSPEKPLPMQNAGNTAEDENKKALPAGTAARRQKMWESLYIEPFASLPDMAGTARKPGSGMPTEQQKKLVCTHCSRKFREVSGFSYCPYCAGKLKLRR